MQKEKNPLVINNFGNTIISNFIQIAFINIPQIRGGFMNLGALFSHLPTCFPKNCFENSVYILPLHSLQNKFSGMFSASQYH